MYHLLVSHNIESWNGEPFKLEISRCIQEYTDTKFIEKYANLTESIINEIKQFPCVFAYEKSCAKNPKFGFLREIKKRSKEVKIEYEIINLEKFLTYEELFSNLFEFDILEWEMNRTHWAIKNVNLLKELNSMGIKLPEGVNRISKAVDIRKHYFDVALSFPGEIRQFVKSIVFELEPLIGPNAYFYDNNYLAQLATPSLDTLLQDIYKNRSKLIVVFLCQKYQDKQWCGIEFRAIKDIIKNRQDEKVMLIKMDDGIVDGIFSIDGYIDGKMYTSKEIANFIKERIDLI